MLNSRPISVLSEDPNDPTPLTPADLCCGSKVHFLPSPEVNPSTPSCISGCSPAKRWAFIQRILLNFWKRWSKEYVPILQERGKWTKEVKNLLAGDLVYIMDDIVPPLQWPLGRIVYVYSGPDQFVRVVKVKTSTGTYNRCVHKLQKLPLFVQIYLAAVQTTY